MSSFNFATKSIIASIMMAVFAVASSGAMAADTKWEKNHPRRDRVNDRLHHQNMRIRDEVREGEMTHAQARKLHRKDRRIRREERVMANQNGGRITKSEQKALNHQEDTVSKQIGK